MCPTHCVHCQGYYRCNYTHKETSRQLPGINSEISWGDWCKCEAQSSIFYNSSNKRKSAPWRKSCWFCCHIIILDSRGMKNSIICLWYLKRLCLKFQNNLFPGLIISYERNTILFFKWGNILFYIVCCKTQQATGPKTLRWIYYFSLVTDYYYVASFLVGVQRWEC